MFGTFDVANFGDVLFPIVAAEMFRQIDPSITLEPYSFRRKSADSWFYDVSAIQDFPEAIPTTDLVLIGGGHLVHSNPDMAPGYGPTDPTIPNPYGFWWLPAVAGRMAGVPVALHALSVEPTFPVWTRPLLEAFTDSLDYATARETLSCRCLEQMGAKEVTLVPDSIFSIHKLITRGVFSSAYERFKSDHGITKPYLIVQPSTALRDDQPAIRALIAEAQAKGMQVLELPIYQEKLNPVGYYASIPGVVLTRYPPDPRLLAEVIANAQGVVGVSLHLTIVALVYGIPAYRKRYGDQTKFVLLDGLRNIHFLDTNPSLVESAFEPDPIIVGYQTQLDEHYARLVALAKAGAATPHRARGWALLAATPYAMLGTRSLSETVAANKFKARRLLTFVSAFLLPIVGKLTPKSVRRR